MNQHLRCCVQPSITQSLRIAVNRHRHWIYSKRHVWHVGCHWLFGWIENWRQSNLESFNFLRYLASIAFNHPSMLNSKPYFYSLARLLALNSMPSLCCRRGPTKDWMFFVCLLDHRTLNVWRIDGHNTFGSCNFFSRFSRTSYDLRYTLEWAHFHSCCFERLKKMCAKCLNTASTVGTLSTHSLLVDCGCAVAASLRWVVKHLTQAVYC